MKAVFISCASREHLPGRSVLANHSVRACWVADCSQICIVAEAHRFLDVIAGDIHELITDGNHVGPTLGAGQR